MNKAVFLDRDGVLNLARLGSYVNCADDLKVFDFAGPALSILNEMGYICIVVTNQSGIAKGFFGLSALVEIHNKLIAELLEAAPDAKIQKFYTCPHGYDDPMCKCRKPKPGNLLTAAQEFDLDLSECYMVGDMESDIGAGKNAGCHTVAVTSGLATEEEILQWETRPEYMFHDVYCFAINLRTEEIRNGMGPARAEEEWPPAM
jgi:D-glycero-D-manno-heptose 1,7-bisphosphate phosphatase